jgi:hypothetical protein
MSHAATEWWWIICPTINYPLYCFLLIWHVWFWVRLARFEFDQRRIVGSSVWPTPNLAIYNIIYTCFLQSTNNKDDSKFPKHTQAFEDTSMITYHIIYLYIYMCSFMLCHGLTHDTKYCMCPYVIYIALFYSTFYMVLDVYCNGIRQIDRQTDRQTDR